MNSFFNHRPILLCLHGWGGSKESFTELREALKGEDIEILTPDLPGFGSEPEPKKPWTTDDYADWVVTWLQRETRNEKRETYLLGHSHGGRIALKLVTSKPANQQTNKFHVEHLFLCAAAGIRHPRHFKRILGLTLAKTGKTFLKIPGIRALQPLGKKFLYQLVRVHDYENASPIMRQTLINVSAEDLTPLLKNVNIPTDMFWGKEDRMTPFADALLMQSLIAGSHIHAFSGVRHRVHRDRAAEIATVIRETLKHS